MTRPIAILTSDWHIADGAWKHRDVKGDACYSLGQIVDHAVEHGLPILAAGDLYDTDDPDPQSVAFVCQQIDRLSDEQLYLYYIQGQHERHRSGGTWLGIHDWPTHVDGRRDVVGNLLIYGFDWVPASRLPEAIAAIPPDVDLVMCHQVWAEFKVGGSNAEGRLSDIPGSMLVLTGDYHVTKTIAAGEHTVLSPGSISVQSIDEDPVKYFFVLHDDMSLAPVRLKTRRVGHFQVYSQDDLDRFLVDRPWEPLLEAPELPTHLRKPLVSVSFSPDIPLVARRLSEALNPVVHYFPSPVFHRQAANDAADAPVLYRGLLDALEHEVPAEAPEHAPLRRLLSARPDTLAAELASIRREFFECQRRAPRPGSPA